MPGVNAGYNKQFGATVLGAEAEVNWGSQNHRGQEEQDNINFQSKVVSRVDGSAALLARLGMAVQDSMFYVGAGPALAHASGDVNSYSSNYYAAYGAPNPSNSSTGRTIWTNSQSVATIGAAWHF
jgi:hypothetical protein